MVPEDPLRVERAAGVILWPLLSSFPSISHCHCLPLAEPTGRQLTEVFETHRLLCDMEQIGEMAKNGPVGKQTQA